MTPEDEMVSNARPEDLEALEATNLLPGDPETVDLEQPERITRPFRALRYSGALDGFVTREEIPELLEAYGFDPVLPDRFPFQAKVAPPEGLAREPYVKSQDGLVVLYIGVAGEYFEAPGKPNPAHRWEIRMERLKS